MWKRESHTPLMDLIYRSILICLCYDDLSKATMAPVSPSTVLSKPSPVPNLTSLTDAEIRKQKMEKLARCLGETGPQEMVFPSFGQVGQEAQRGALGVAPSTYLDLYRQHSAAVADTSKLADVKSPKPRGDAQLSWKTMDDLDKDVMLSPTPLSASEKRKSVLRRSRSVGDFYSVEEILAMKSAHVELSPKGHVRRASDTLVSAIPSSSIHPFASPVNMPIEYRNSTSSSSVLKRRDSMESMTQAKLAILGDDAQRMARFRMSFKPRPLDLTFDWEETPMSPAQPTALEVRSPRAPYWVKPVVVPKTPRTLRTEKRQGWGGKWDFVEVGMTKYQQKRL